MNFPLLKSLILYKILTHPKRENDFQDAYNGTQFICILIFHDIPKIIKPKE